MYTIRWFVFILSCFNFIYFPVSSVICYQCVSTHPGCGTPFQWWWYQTISCPEEEDVCVKIVEIKDGQEVITRDCLSTFKGIRTDIPADHYEGCRSSAVDVKLANYVNNSIKELDIKRNYYDSVTFCFCYFDNWCNAGTRLPISFFGILTTATICLWTALSC